MSELRRGVALAWIVVALGMVAGCGGGGGASGAEVGFRPANDGWEIAGSLFLLPDAAGVEIRGASIDEGPFAGDAESSMGLVLGRVVEGGFNDLVGVVVSDAESDREIGAEEQARVETIDVNGVDARLDESVLHPSVDWHADGRAVAVIGPKGRNDLIVAVARALDPQGEADDLLTTVPEGLELLATVPDTIQPDATEETVWGWSVLLDIDGDGVSVNATQTTAPMLGWFAHVGAAEVRRIGVRGTDGFWSAQAFDATSESGAGSVSFTLTTLSWAETPDLMVRISGSADLDTLVAVAESLAAVPRAEFERHDIHNGIMPEGPLPTGPTHGDP